MNEKSLAAVLEMNMADSLSDMCKCDAIADDYSFSKEFEDSMRLIFETGSIESRRRVNISKRLKLIFIAAAIFAAGFLLGSSNGNLWSFKYDRSNSKVIFSAPESDTPQKTMGLACTISDIPQGYRLDFSDITPTGAVQSYSDSKGGYIFFTQQVVSQHEDYTVENAHTDYVQGCNGIKYFVCTTEGSCSVKWYDGNYIFSVYSSLNKDELVKLCSSAKVADAPE